MEVEIWPRASEDVKRYFKDVTHIKRDRLKALWEAEMHLPESSKTIISAWAQAEKLAPQDFKHSAREAYLRLSLLMRKKDTSFEEDVFRRFQLCIFYTVFLTFSLENSGASRGVFASVICDKEDEENTARDVRSWVASGATYVELAVRTGGYGILLALPSTVPRSIWENHLRSSSDRFEEAMVELNRRGLTEFARSLGAFQAGERLAQAAGLPSIADILQLRKPRRLQATTEC